MADDNLIDDYLSALANRLPADVVDEIADGMLEACRHRVACGASVEEAQQATVEEFGPPAVVNRAFVVEASGRRAARALLVSGPAVGLCWGAALVTAGAWRWSVPPVLVVTFGLALVLVVAALVSAGLSRRNLSVARAGRGAGLGLVVLDVLMIVAVLRVATTATWPLALAVLASLIRVTLVLRTWPRTSPS